MNIKDSRRANRINIHFFKALAVIFLIYSMNYGCGYRFRTTGEPMNNGFKSISIPIVESTSTTMGFESEFTSAIRDEFISYSKLPILPEDSADIIILCRIYEINEEPIAYRLTRYDVKGTEITHEVTRSKRMSIKMDVKVKERETGRLLWHEKAMMDRAIYLVDDDPLVTRFNRKTAIKEIAERISKRIYLRTMERF